MATPTARLAATVGLGFAAVVAAYLVQFPTGGLWIVPLWLAGAAVAVAAPGGRAWLAGVAGILVALVVGGVVAALARGNSLALALGLPAMAMLFLAPPYTHGWVAGWLGRRARRLGRRGLDVLTVSVSGLEIAAAAYAVWLADELAQHPL